MAHESIKQCRADGTRYIDHPRRVSVMAANHATLHGWGDNDVIHIACAGVLHDVLEDVEWVTEERLIDLDIPKPIIHTVKLLTKSDPNKPPTEEYYVGIATERQALLDKFFDRYDNVQEAAKNVRSGNSKLGRWERYVLKTKRDIYPLYKDHQLLPLLVQEVDDLEVALVIERQRRKSL